MELAALRTPAVRDLAFLLGTPPPWLSAADIAPARLLGAQGWPQLLALDAAPQPLLAYLAAHPSRRLGFYAERLLAFWFERAPHIELVAANLPLRADGITVGEFDFLLRIDGKPCHLETASKFYLQTDDGDPAWIGTSLRDALLLKAAKTVRQLQLSRHPAALLPDGFAACEAVALTRGWLFRHRSATDAPLPAPLDAAAMSGWWCRLGEAWPLLDGDSRWCLLPRLRWLAPALLDAGEVCTAEALRAQLQAMTTPQLVAALRQDDTGSWRECSRGFVVPDAWPQPALLAPLRARLAAIA